MTILVTLQAQLIVGEEQVIKSLAPEGMLAAVFEDDGRTGYFYALDESLEETRFLMQCISTMSRIYQTPTFLLTLKSAGLKTVKCVLLINGYPHAAFDFVGKNGYCRSGYPPINKVWSVSGHEWSDSVDDFFR
jgi:hypothetical protein